VEKENINERDLIDNHEDLFKLDRDKSDKKTKSKKNLVERPSTLSPTRNVIKEIKIPSG
jgi:hypothetical protein